MKTKFTSLCALVWVVILSLSFNQAKAQLKAVITDSTAASCNGSNNGTATVTASGGTSPYNYYWSTTPAQTNAMATGLVAGTYTVTVTDAVSDRVYATVTINGLGMNTSSTAATCGLSNGSATVYPTGGASPYTYIWSPTNQTNATAVGLSAGNYSVIVRDKNGCSATSAYVAVTQPTVIAITVVSVTNTKCYGGNDGAITISASAGAAPYTYLWAPTGVTSATITGLPAGNYTVTVTDGTGCSSNRTIAVGGPSQIMGRINVISCSCPYNGCSSINITGGIAPYKYTWSSGATGDTVCGLSVGVYTVTVTDSNGCTGATKVNVSATLTVTPNITQNTSCISPNGMATVTVSGGITPYTYSWAPYGGSSATATGLGEDTFTVEVTDALGNKGFTTVAISQPSSIGATYSFTPATCNLNNGSATVTVTGGVPPYTYLWNPTAANTATVVGLSSGIYTVTVTDNSGCSVSPTVDVTKISGITISVLSVGYISCFGGNNGSIDISVSGGSIPYSYSWTTGGFTGYETGLTAGIYTVTVTDANNCSATAKITVTQPPLLTVSTQISSNIACNGGNNGCATATAMGGTPPYTYFWTPIGGGSATLCGLAASIYTVTVEDANGCTATATATPTQPALLTPTSTMAQNTSCVSPNGTATVSVTGGISPYTYLWEPTGQTSTTAIGLSTGTYTCTVTDNHGCYDTTSIVVTGSGTGSNTYTEPICILTIDTANNKTEVIWGRTNAPPAGGSGYFKLYKDSVGGYIPVHTQPLDSLSRFVDLLSDPSSGPQSYELSTVDSCGESALSLPHTSIYLTTTAGKNVFILNWTAYVGFTPVRYRIFRGPSLSQLTQIDSVPNNVFTYHDTLAPLGSFYVLEAVNPSNSCIPTKATHNNKHTDIALSLLSGSFSNGFNTRTLGIKNIENAVSNLKAYPNPSNGIFTIEWAEISGQLSTVRISIVNELGQVVYTEQKQAIIGANTAHLNIENLAQGIYTLRIETDNGVAVSKLMIMGKQ